MRLQALCGAAPCSGSQSSATVLDAEADEGHGAHASEAQTDARVYLEEEWQTYLAAVERAGQAMTQTMAQEKMLLIQTIVGLETQLERAQQTQAVSLQSQLLLQEAVEGLKAEVTAMQASSPSLMEACVQEAIHKLKAEVAVSTDPLIGAAIKAELADGMQDQFAYLRKAVLDSVRDHSARTTARITSQVTDKLAKIVRKEIASPMKKRRAPATMASVKENEDAEKATREATEEESALRDVGLHCARQAVLMHGEISTGHRQGSETEDHILEMLSRTWGQPPMSHDALRWAMVSGSAADTYVAWATEGAMSEAMRQRSLKAEHIADMMEQIRAVGTTACSPIRRPLGVVANDMVGRAQGARNFMKEKEVATLGGQNHHGAPGGSRCGPDALLHDPMRHDGGGVLAGAGRRHCGDAPPDHGPRRPRAPRARSPTLRTRTQRMQRPAEQTRSRLICGRRRRLWNHRVPVLLHQRWLRRRP